jgi:hypothetical protein
LYSTYQNQAGQNTPKGGADSGLAVQKFHLFGLGELDCEEYPVQSRERFKNGQSMILHPEREGRGYKILDNLSFPVPWLNFFIILCTLHPEDNSFLVVL